MSTRLSGRVKAQAVASLDELLSSGVRFIDCPLDDGEISTLWNSLLDPAYLQSAQGIADVGIDLTYLLLDSSAEFYVATGDTLHAVTFHRNRRAFYKAPPKQVLAMPRSWAGSVPVPKRLLTTYEDMAKTIGEEKTAEFRDWVSACDTMDTNLKIATSTVEELFDMVKTSGQLRRMVPDLFKYIPEEQRAALDDQKRASSYPFEWAAYPRKNVDTLLTTLFQCQLLKGSERERRQHTNLETRGHWAAIIRNVSIAEK